jgi:hypothetical protein
MKAFFMGRLLREKFLLIVFIGIGAFIWLGRVTEQGRAWWAELRSTAVERDVQVRWLGQRDIVAARQRAAIANLDSAKTYDGVRLQAEISTMARAAGLVSADVAPAKSSSSAQLAVHTVTVVLRNVELAGLVKFYRVLGQHSPYISIEKCRIDASRSNANQITATFDLSSVEVKLDDGVALVR